MELLVNNSTAQVKWPDWYKERQTWKGTENRREGKKEGFEEGNIQRARKVKGRKRNEKRKGRGQRRKEVQQRGRLENKKKDIRENLYLFSFSIWVLSRSNGAPIMDAPFIRLSVCTHETTREKQNGFS